MRRILVDWLVDVHRKFKLRMDTMAMCIYILEQFMCKTKEPVSKSKFQLVGIASLFIAAKYEEIYPPSLRDFVYVCADTYRSEELLDMEARILHVLNFELVHASCLQLHAVWRLQQVTQSREDHLVQYLAFTCFLSSRLMREEERVRAASVVYLSKKILSLPADASVLARDFCADPSKVKDAALHLFMLLTSGADASLTAVKRMFNHHHFSYVASLQLSLKL